MTNPRENLNDRFLSQVQLQTNGNMWSVRGMHFPSGGRNQKAEVPVRTSQFPGTVLETTVWTFRVFLIAFTYDLFHKSVLIKSLVWMNNSYFPCLFIMLLNNLKQKITVKKEFPSSALQTRKSLPQNSIYHIVFWGVQEGTGRAVQLVAHRPHAAQDGCECVPTPNCKFT